jgi:PAS domain S-box-containing protein
MEEQVADPAQEVKCLQRCINDLVGLLSLPAIWRGGEPSQIIQTLLDVLLRMLSLEFAYARLNDAFDAMPVEILRVAKDAKVNLPQQELREVLGDWFSAGAPGSLPQIRSRLRVEEISIFPVPLGIQGEIGVIVLGSNRVGFPEKTESLLLTVAANQASIGLQEATLLSQQKRIAAELERRVAERTAELEAANAELQLQVGLLQHLPVSAWTLQPDGTPDFVNQVWLGFSGQTLDFVRSHPEAWMTAVHPEDREMAAKCFWEGVQTGHGFAFETRSLRAKDGTYRWHLQQAVVLRDAEGKVLRFVGTTTDIDEQKRAQEKLRASENSLKQIINTIPTPAWSARPDGYCDFVNQRWLDYAGLSTEQGLGWGWAQAVHPDDLGRLNDYWLSTIAAGRPGEIEARLRRFDGAYRWFLFRASPLRDEAGAIVKWYGTNTDIDDRRLAEEALRARELDTRSLLDNMPGFLARLSSDGIPEIFNRPFLQYLGKTLEEIREWRMSDIVHPDDLAHTIEVFGNGISTGHSFDFQYRLRRFDGAYRWFQARVVPVRNTEGQILRWNTLVTDIDEQKRAEDELRVAQSELARVMRVMTMGQLTASIAHEVNQPLSGIITNASTCLRMLDTNPPNLEGARETARRTIRDGHRASDVITRLRTLYSKKEPALETMDLNEVAREVTALSSTEIQRNGVTLRQEFAEDLPPALGDRVQLQQVILNLLRNAADAMSTIADRPRELLVRTERDEGNQVRLSVKDSGVGFTLQAADKIFEAFYTTKPGGMGIGLSISRSIIEAHQGRLWATRNDGAGSTFSFAIPCAVETLGEAEARVNQSDPSVDAA